jgi:hypothetical protein
MILPPFFGHPTPPDDGEPYRINYSYIGEDVHTYANLPKTISRHAYIGIDVVTYKIKQIPQALVYTYLSQDSFTYQKPTKNLILTYTAIDCLTYRKQPDPPPAPLNIFGSNGDTISNLSWVAPVYDGLSIRDYFIQKVITNGNVLSQENNYPILLENGDTLLKETNTSFELLWETINDGFGVQTSAVLTGLINNNEYLFRIASVSLVGAGGYGYSNFIYPYSSSQILHTIKPGDEVQVESDLKKSGSYLGSVFSNLMGYFTYRK